MSPVNVNTVVLFHHVLSLPGYCQAAGQELVILLNFLEEACNLRRRTVFSSDRSSGSGSVRVSVCLSVCPSVTFMNSSLNLRAV